MPRPRGGDSKERAKAMSKAGKRIALGEEAPLFQTNNQADFVEYNPETLAKKAGSVDTFTSNMELTWEAPEGSDPYPQWESTMRSFADKTAAATVTQADAVKPPTAKVHWKFGDEKRTWETAFKTDFPAYDTKYIVNPYSNRTKGPKLAALNFGDDENPNQYRSMHSDDFTFDPSEVEANKVTIVKPPKSRGLKFGEEKVKWETSASCDYIVHPKTEFKKYSAAVDVKKSTVCIGEDENDWTSSYSLEVGKAQKGEMAARVGQKPLVTTVKIGDGVTKIYETSARTDYKDPAASQGGVQPQAVRPRKGSCVTLGEDKDVLWQTVDRDRLDPRTVPGAYIPTERTGAAVQPKHGEKAPNRILNSGFKTSAKDYVSGYAETFARGNDDCKTSKRKSSRPKKSGIMTFGDDGDPDYSTTYFDGQGKGFAPGQTPSLAELKSANIDTSKSSVHIGQNPTTDYTTTMNTTTPLYPEKHYHMIKQKAAVDIKKANVKLGNEKLSYETASGSDYLAFRYTTQ